MANTTSAIKAYKQSLKRNFINKNRKSKVKTFIKKLEKNLNKITKDEAMDLFKNVQSEISKGVNKGIYKKNTASRKVSKLSQKMKVAFA